MKWINNLFFFLIIIVVIFNVYLLFSQKHVKNMSKLLINKVNYYEIVLSNNFVKNRSDLNDFKYINTEKELLLFIPNSSCGTCVNNLLRLMDHHNLTQKTCLVLENGSYFNHLYKKKSAKILEVSRKVWPQKTSNVPFFVFKINDCVNYIWPYNDDYPELSELVFKSLELIE